MKETIKTFEEQMEDLDEILEPMVKDIKKYFDVWLDKLDSINEEDRIIELEIG